MQFVIHSSSISIEGDDMVSIFRDAAGGALDDACGEINAVIATGSGSILIRKGTADDILHPMDAQYSGAVSALDAFGRYHLTAEKVLTHDLSIDLSGKTWRDPGECGNQGWFLEDNSLDMTSRSWTDIGDREMIKTRTDLTLRDVDDKPTSLEAATFGLEAISGLDIVGSYILFPLTPIDLYAFFGERELQAGSNSEESDKWSWSVGEEINDPNHGLVYPISLSHKEFDICNGHVRIDLKVKKGVPWPVSQEASIIVDKSQGTSECGLVESTLSDAAMVASPSNCRCAPPTTTPVRAASIGASVTQASRGRARTGPAPAPSARGEWRCPTRAIPESGTSKPRCNAPSRIIHRAARL
jgi:hypothetical protein